MATFSLMRRVFPRRIPVAHMMLPLVLVAACGYVTAEALVRYAAAPNWLIPVGLTVMLVTILFGASAHSDHVTTRPECTRSAPQQHPPKRVRPLLRLHHVASTQPGVTISVITIWIAALTCLRIALWDHPVSAGFTVGIMLPVFVQMQINLTHHRWFRQCPRCRHAAALAAAF